MQILRNMLYLFGILAIVSSCQEKTTTPEEGEATKTYTFDTFPDDPLGLKRYTLENGLQVYISEQKDEPRIQTMIAVRTGSKNDPSDATGLAHYLEHMLFKGTSKVGSLDWEKEKIILEQISDLYEKHRDAPPAERAAIYNKIDSLSFLAAQYVSPNEYDRMVSSLGAKGSNAYTSFDQTVYIGDIPTAGLEKWLMLESERFGELVLRLFHTELETVYEEFNISQTNDGSQAFHAYLKALLAGHPYGEQTTIGTGEHLKTPSMQKIQKYFDTYYVPNNMAIILSGDIDPQNAVRLVEKHFGQLKRKPLPETEHSEAKPLEGPVVKELFGREKPFLQMVYRTAGAGTKDDDMASLCSRLLQNGQAGIMDEELLQTQRIGQESYSFSYAVKDYGFFGFKAYPRAGQPLEEVKDLLLQQLERLREGDFEDWLIKAAVRDMEYGFLNSLQSRRSRASYLTDAFVYEYNWPQFLKRFDRLREVTKADVMEFVEKNFEDNYVLVYKRQGEPKDILRVEKPKITQLEVQRDTASTFKKAWDTVDVAEVKPIFADYQASIQQEELDNGLALDYMHNKDNDLYQLNFIWNMGEYNQRLLPVLANYFDFISADSLSVRDLKRAFFKLGIRVRLSNDEDETYLTIRGLDETLEEGLKLVEHLVQHAQGSQVALDRVKSDLMKTRLDRKTDKRLILNRALYERAKYGEDAPLRYEMSASELQELSAEQLIELFQKLPQYEHRVFYYGPRKQQEVAALLMKRHVLPDEWLPYPKKKEFAEQAIAENQVLFVDYPGMVQARILMAAQTAPTYSEDIYVWGQLYNNYFGLGLSSIVFQEIREAKGLAYTAWASQGTPNYRDEGHYLRAFVGTQSDKMREALTALQDIMRNMPLSEEQISSARSSLLNKIASDRLTRSSIYWSARSDAKLGYDYDVRRKVYERLSGEERPLSDIVQSLKEFQEKYVKEQTFTYLVLGDKSQLDMDYLTSLGTFKELKVEELLPK